MYFLHFNKQKTLNVLNVHDLQYILSKYNEQKKYTYYWQIVTPLEIKYGSQFQRGEKDQLIIKDHGSKNLLQVFFC